YYRTPPPTHSTLSLHDALPIWARQRPQQRPDRPGQHEKRRRDRHQYFMFDHVKRKQPLAKPMQRRYQRPNESEPATNKSQRVPRSEEHTSELQSRENLVCRLLI